MSELNAMIARIASSAQKVSVCRTYRLSDERAALIRLCEQLRQTHQATDDDLAPLLRLIEPSVVPFPISSEIKSR